MRFGAQHRVKEDSCLLGCYGTMTGKELLMFQSLADPENEDTMITLKCHSITSQRTKHSAALA